MERIRINLYDILLSISDAIDIVTPELANHHQQVAYFSFRLAEQLGLSKKEQRNIIIEGLLHDIGALSLDERMALIEAEPITVNSHAFRSATLLERCNTFVPYADSVRYHHVPWNHGNGMKWENNQVPINSHLMHLADRVCVLVKPHKEILSQIPDIVSFIQKNTGVQFMPDAVDAFIEISKKEHIWLELTDKSPLTCIPDMTVYGVMDLELDEIISIAKMFSHVIDFRSHTTATHSAGVANIAKKLGELIGFSKDECKKLLIAGYIHDIGKLAVDNSVLNKPSNLNKQEFNAIRSHTFYTYQLLRQVQGFETINKWASYHHEKLNGNGYPFHLKADSIPLGSRIMAVADVFTAITENRVYRKGMDKDGVIRVLKSMTEDGSICGKVVDVLLDNFDLLTDICKESHKESAKEYGQFFPEEVYNFAENA